jgi:hypothetical protein
MKGHRLTVGISIKPNAAHHLSEVMDASVRYSCIIIDLYVFQSELLHRYVLYGNDVSWKSCWLFSALTD